MTSPTNRADDSLLAAHITEENDRYAAIQQSLEELKSMLTGVNSAFVKDEETNLPDYAGHHNAHKAWIAAQNAKREFWEKLKLELVKYGLIGFLGWLLVQVVWPAIVKGHV